MPRLKQRLVKEVVHIERYYVEEGAVSRAGATRSKAIGDMNDGEIIEATDEGVKKMRARKNGAVSQRVVTEHR